MASSAPDCSIVVSGHLRKGSCQANDSLLGLILYEGNKDIICRVLRQRACAVAHGLWEHLQEGW
ncbi:MAG: hypothetical protein QOH48_356 [Actinomycetota bacterium]|jgi:hypothetical protein|nr:hypothetical protein [Actinomycetota bacterium]